MQRYIEEHNITPAVRQALGRYAAALGSRMEDRDARRVREEIRAMLHGEPVPALTDGAWGSAVMAELADLPEEQRAAWDPLLAHCRDCRAARPSKKWLAKASELIEPLGKAEFRRCAIRWLEQLAKTPVAPIPPQNEEVLRGLCWTCGLVPNAELCRAVGAAAEACFKSIPRVGPRSLFSGNGALVSLSLMATTEAVAELVRLRSRIKARAPLKTLERILEDAAARTGKSREELEELSVPTSGLDADGVLRASVGGYQAEITFTLSGGAEWRWIPPDGKTQKSVPVEVKREHAAALAALKGRLKPIQQLLPAQRARVERLMRSECGWDLATWRERYLDHPVMRQITRRLIWHFGNDHRTALGIWHEGQFVNERHRPLLWLVDDTRVRLWQPIGFPPETVLQWREWLEEHRIVQPFKQAHREVYLITDAELETRIYSNRFAGHVLRQHQFRQLCLAKGWRYQLQGMFDSADGPIASLDLPEWGLRVEFWVELPEGEAAESGIYLYVTTDQVRFLNRETSEPLPLSEVPALALTEAMRDVDLFVSVASIGTDPGWQNRGDQPYEAYWREFSFGELRESAVKRREVLERLLPRLKIASRCNIDGRYLRVRGDRRTYKIHLGSGNILMEPNNRYLCIVQGRSSLTRAESVFLPFEGDTLLAVILSKAFLLAEDTKIKDPTILSQIR